MTLKFCYPFVYTFTLETHLLTFEYSQRSALAAHLAKHEAVLKQCAEDKERVRREAVWRVAPGFEPEPGLMEPDGIARNDAEETCLEG